MDGFDRYSDSDKAWLQLALRPGLGASRLRVLQTRYGSGEAILGLSDAELAALPVSLANPLRAALDEALYARCLEWLTEPNHHLLTWDHTLYPSLLAEIYDPPPLLFVAGNVALLSDPQIALVGTRKPSPSGRESSYRFAAALAQAGLCVTSGLALGVDGAAHSGALSVSGATVAVLGCGPDRCYPRAHRALREDILSAGGAVVSEFPPGTAPKAGHFPKRNRIISGLSLGVLVVEAALRSGSLITARQALEQGREVFSLPGAIQNPQSHGCHELIRQGATLVEYPEHLLEALQLPLRTALHSELESEPQNDAVPAIENELLALIDFSVTALEVLAQRSGLSAAALQPRLLELELTGAIAVVPGGVQRIR